jgi:predicted Rdx family selenoprotein
MAYTLSKQYLWKEVGDQVVILHYDSGRYFSLNASGSVIWKAALENLSQEQIVQRVCDEFDVNRETAHQDIEVTVRSFVDREFLIQS